MKKLMAKTGSYEKDGQTKGRYVQIGVIMSNDNGEFCLLDPTVNLAGCLTQQNMENHKAGRKPGDRLMVSIFDDSQDRQQSSGYGAGGQPSDDEIPFAPVL